MGSMGATATALRDVSVSHADEGGGAGRPAAALLPPMAPPRIAPRPPPRDLRLDVVRGWMQISIFISHVVGTSFLWGIHAAWGISDSSEQFVFLSGLALGSVFALKSGRNGYAVARTDLAHRTWHLYRTHLVVVALFAALIFAAEAWLLPGEAMRRGWDLLAEAPLLAVPGSAIMLWQPDWMGILPVFVWCMLLLAPFMWLAERAGAWALLPPLLAYAAVQAGLLATPAISENGIAFDPLAWQMIFLIGAFLGRRALLGEALPRQRWLVAAAVGVVLFGLWVRLVGHGFIAGPEQAMLTINDPGSIFKTPPRRGNHGGMLWLFFRVFEGRTLVVVAEIKLHECWIITGYWN